MLPSSAMCSTGTSSPSSRYLIPVEVPSWMLVGKIFGAEGMLLNDNLRPTTLRRYGTAETEAREPLLNFFLERYADAYRLELDAFVEAVEAGRPMPVTVADGKARNDSTFRRGGTMLSRWRRRPPALSASFPWLLS